MFYPISPTGYHGYQPKIGVSVCSCRTQCVQNAVQRLVFFNTKVRSEVAIHSYSNVLPICIKECVCVGGGGGVMEMVH